MTNRIIFWSLFVSVWVSALIATIYPNLINWMLISAFTAEVLMFVTMFVGGRKSARGQ
jgi:hypothetical protein